MSKYFRNFIFRPEHLQQSWYSMITIYCLDYNGIRCTLVCFLYSKNGYAMPVCVYNLYACTTYIYVLECFPNGCVLVGVYLCTGHMYIGCFATTHDRISNHPERKQQCTHLSIWIVEFASVIVQRLPQPKWMGPHLCK